MLNPGDRAEVVIQRLHEAKIRFDTRAYGIRLSPHVYNQGEDIEALAECLAPFRSE